MKKYTKAEINLMLKELEENNIIIETTDTINGGFLVKYKTLVGSISFMDFNQDLDIFKIYIEELFPVPDKENKINFDIEDLKQSILNPICTCGGHVECCYDGEYSENYYFTCECGATETLNGYILDSLVDENLIY